MESQEQFKIRRSGKEPPFFYNEETIGVYRGNNRIGSVRRNIVMGYRFEKRSSFKHPIVGIVVGLVMMEEPVRIITGSPLGIQLLFSYSVKYAAILMVIFGLGMVMVWNVITRHDEPWIIFVTEKGDVGLPIHEELSPEAKSLLRKFFGEPMGDEKGENP